LSCAKRFAEAKNLPILVLLWFNALRASAYSVPNQYDARAQRRIVLIWEENHWRASPEILTRMTAHFAAYRCFFLHSLLGAFSASVATTAFALGPPPSVQITGIDTSQPRGSCDLPAIELLVNANGNASHSDNFFVIANGELIYSWSGESMAWVNVAGANTYSISAGTANLAPNTTVTARIDTYDSVNPDGPIFTAGDVVYRSEISWNCTTGAPLGAISNFNLRANTVVPTLQPIALMCAALLLGLIGARQSKKHAAA
jgi:hypothetical protein